MALSPPADVAGGAYSATALLGVTATSSGPRAPAEARRWYRRRRRWRRGQTEGPSPSEASAMTDERSPAVDLSWYQDVRRMPPIRSSTDRRAIRRRRTLDVLACLALAALCFSRASSETLLRVGWDFYSRTPLGPPTLQALFLNIVALAAAGYLGVLVIRRTQRAAWRRPAAVAAAAVLLVSLNYARITYETLGRWTDVGRSGLLALVVLALVASLVWPRPALQAIRCVALAASPLAVITLMLAAWMFFETAAGPVWRRVAPRPLERAAP